MYQGLYSAVRERSQQCYTHSTCTGNAHSRCTAPAGQPCLDYVAKESALVTTTAGQTRARCPPNHSASTSARPARAQAGMVSWRVNPARPLRTTSTPDTLAHPGPLPTTHRAARNLNSLGTVPALACCALQIIATAFMDVTAWTTLQKNHPCRKSC